MKLLERILVATDFGFAAEDAVRTAAYVARKFDSHIDLLHIKPPAEGPPPPDADEIDQLISRRLDEIAEQLVGEGVRSVEAVALEGDPFVEINHYASEHDVNVIIVGAGEISPSGQFYLGTAAAQLRRGGCRPVWIVKPGEPLPIRHILCPVDLLPASARALRNAIHIARTLDAELTVLHVTQAAYAEYESIRPSAGEAPEPTGESEAPAEQPYVPELNEFLRGLDFHDVRWKKLVVPGKPRYEVPRVARERGAELIVMGSAGRTGISRMLIGGVARRVAQELPCSIVTVRSAEPIRVSVDAEIPVVDPDFCATHPTADQCDRFRHGEELLARGLAEEALEHFRDCASQYTHCVRAWKALALSHERLGQTAQAEQYRRRAEQTAARLAREELNEELREEHILHRRMFGI